MMKLSCIGSVAGSWRVLAAMALMLGVGTSGCVGDAMDDDDDDEMALDEAEEVGTASAALIHHYGGHTSRHISHIHYDRGYQYWLWKGSGFFSDGGHWHRWAVYRCTSSKCTTKTYLHTRNYEVGYRTR
jgi:hypothetical protein